MNFLRLLPHLPGAQYDESSTFFIAVLYAVLYSYPNLLLQGLIVLFQWSYIYQEQHVWNWWLQSSISICSTPFVIHKAIFWCLDDSSIPNVTRGSAVEWFMLGMYDKDVWLMLEQDCYYVPVNSPANSLRIYQVPRVYPSMFLLHLVGTCYVCFVCFVRC